MKPIYEPRGRALEYAPLACNLYRGCLHGCKYCFAPNVLRMDRADFHSSSQLREGALEALEKQLATGDYAGKRILLSFTTDPYQPGEFSRGHTRTALELIKKYGANFEILTKGGVYAVPDFDLYGESDRFGTSLTFDNENDSMKWEPMAAKPDDRMEAIRIAHERGIFTWASMEPVISPEQTLSLIRMTSGIVDLYKIGKANYVKGLEVDWKKFINDAVELCEQLEVDYYIKKDLTNLVEK